MFNWLIGTVVVVSAVWVLIYLNRDAVEDVVAHKISDAIHAPDSPPTPGPSFIMDFGKGVGKKVLQLEIGRL